jgi:hypothetical protein
VQDHIASERNVLAVEALGAAHGYAAFSQGFPQFLHLASDAVSEKAVAVGVPAFERAKTNPMAIAAGRLCSKGVSR